MPTEKHLTGLAGVHYVAFQLSSRGYAVALTGAKDVYLRVTHSRTSKSLSIKVKTSTKAYRTSSTWGPHWSWRLDESLSKRKRKDLILALVDLHGGPSIDPNAAWSPDVYVVPSTDVDELSTKFRRKGARRDVWCSIAEEDTQRYRNKWEIIHDALT
jgi:hypothetical protein